MVFFFILLIFGNVVAESEDVPRVVQRLLHQAGQAMEQNNMEKAIDVLSNYDGKESGHFMIFFTLGNAYMMAEQYNHAKESYLKAVAKNPEYGPAWSNLAKSYMESDQYGPAADAFKTAYEQYEPIRPEMLYYAASTYLAADQPKAALEVFNHLLSAHPKEIKLDWQQVRVRILLANDMPKTALPVIEKLATQMQGDKQKEWQEFLLHQYRFLGMGKKAESYARKLTRIDPLEPRWWKALAHITLDRDQYKQALVALTVYKHLTPLSLEEKKLLADIYLMVEIPGSSIAVLEEILADTSDTQLIEKVVYAYTLCHKPKEALQWIKKGLEEDPKNKKLLLLKGEILFQQNAYAEAKKTFQDVVRQDKTIGKAWLMLGYAAWYDEDSKTALSAMKEAVKFSRYEKAAAEALDDLRRLE